ncbi:hypothetical protein PHYPSEUDO_005900 [Phytophthora pseudosyringae]|uniref:Uncharacterized protein n=1 Tax=Phytophthora pseudosyringae TaxID=221518 RepID=A0A8T1WGN3_9STRA|nr:hypothetical protein PHYPSEUDO_005900 [Phytophthora pseudosyringae]
MQCRKASARKNTTDCFVPFNAALEAVISGVVCTTPLMYAHINRTVQNNIAVAVAISNDRPRRYTGSNHTHAKTIAAAKPTDRRKGELYSRGVVSSALEVRWLTAINGAWSGNNGLAGMKAAKATTRKRKRSPMKVPRRYAPSAELCGSCGYARACQEKATECNREQRSKNEFTVMDRARTPTTSVEGSARSMV